MPPPLDLAGRPFGRLRALRPAAANNGRRSWVCLCDPELGGCGTITPPVLTGNLTQGLSTSCGCARAESLAAVGRANRKTPEGYRKPPRAKPRKAAACPVCGRPLTGRSHKRRHKKCKSTESARASKGRSAVEQLITLSSELKEKQSGGDSCKKTD